MWSKSRNHETKGAFQATSTHALTTISTILDAGQGSLTSIAIFNAVLDRHVDRVRERLRCERGPIRASPDAINRPIFSPITEAQRGKLTSSIQSHPTL